MILGTLRLGGTALHTHNHSYILEGIKAVSTRRPFLSSGVLVAGHAGLFAIGFNDLLYVGEIAALVATSGFSLAFGLCIGQLRLISRDLTGAQATEAVYGTYRHLNLERLEIAAAVERMKSGGVS
jgi:hypothetical protein